MTGGYEKRYFVILKDHQLIGFTAFHLDPAAHSEHRIALRHISLIESAYNEETLAKTLSLILDHIWTQIYCTSVRIEIIHMQDPDTGR